MNSCKVALMSAAAVAFLTLCGAKPAPAMGLAMSAADAGLAAAARESHEPVTFHGHASRGTSYYCYSRNYWWFYRPYTTAAEAYPGCMPYFKYPPQAFRGRRGGAGIK